MGMNLKMTMDRMKKSIKGAKQSLLGTETRDKDAVYQDSHASRARSSKWEPTKAFERTPLYTFIGLFFGSYVLVGILSLIILSIVNKIAMMMLQTNIYPMMGVKFIVNPTISIFLWVFSRWYLILLELGLAIYGYVKMKHRNKKTRLLHDSSGINDYENDAYILTVPEIVAKYKAVPDKGAHFKDVDVSAIVAHLPISNDGLKKQLQPVLKGVGGNGKMGYDKGCASKMLPEFEEEEVTLPNGQKVKRKKIKMAMQPIVDEKDAIAQLNNVGMTDERFHILHSPKKLVVNRRKGATLADWINDTWWFADYETQRPSGIYLVDDAPINVMVVAMTRGNKGQCIINPTIDLWTRQDIKVNIFCNDPKGELYTAFYASLKMRGFETVVFNLLDPDFTDQYNPLSPAIMYARKGYMDEPQKVLTNLASNFFPMPSGGEPIWTQGERMLFNMLALLLIDIYYEEEREYIDKYGDKLDPAQIAQDLDKMWGFVTLPNVYRMVSVLATRKFVPKNPDGTPVIDEDTGEPVGESEQNMLEMLFDFTMQLPMSNIRRLFSSPYANLMAMADSEKMRSSIYGMTLTEMAFFVEGPIVSLTNASPKKSFDLISMSFPRRFQFKFDDRLVRERGYITNMVYFELYRDPYFKDKYEGADYEHVTRVDRLSWVEMRFAAILDQPRTYVKITLRPRGQDTDLVYGTFYAEFTKGYLQTPDGREFLRDPITNEYQIRDGVLRMGVLDEQTGKFKYAHPKDRLLDGEEVNVFEMTEVAYREKPLAVFSVTPPSALVYVKIVLMIIHSMFNSTVENSYMTKESGKPLLKTKYMLDEAGNLSYEGSGIDGFTTKLSIGLAQGQEYTSVFQTLQQITDVYGDTADRIIASNTGLNCFLLSSDIDMLETMSKQAGVHHVARKSVSTTVNQGLMVDEVEDAVSYTTNIQEEPLFSVNRLLRMTNGEALMLSTTKRNENDGSNSRQQPILCTQDTSLPMAWSLHKYGYGQRSFSMLTVPTQSSSIGMGDNIPPFESIIYKRAAQAALAPRVIERYKKDHGLSDMEFDMRMSSDSSAMSREIMGMINRTLNAINSQNQNDSELEAETEVPDVDPDMFMDEDDFVDFDPSELAELEQGTADDDVSDDVLNMSSDDLQALVTEKTGGMVYKKGSGGKVQMDNELVADVDVQKEHSRFNAVQHHLRSKTLGGGRFSIEDMSTGQFKTALALTIRDLPHKTFSEAPGWRVAREGEGYVIYYKDVVMAREVFGQQTQSISLDDEVDPKGHEGIKLGETVTKAVSWSIESSMIDYLKSHPDWAGLFGIRFLETLDAQYRVR